MCYNFKHYNYSTFSFYAFVIKDEVKIIFMGENYDRATKNQR